MERLTNVALLAARCLVSFGTKQYSLACLFQNVLMSASSHLHTHFHNMWWTGQITACSIDTKVSASCFLCILIDDITLFDSNACRIADFTILTCAYICDRMCTLLHHRFLNHLRYQHAVCSIVISTSSC
jgi:hypothetical protein